MNDTDDHRGDVQGDATPGTRWMTYRELAEFLGVEEESSRRRAQRSRWPRRPGNDGKTRVGVPGDVIPDDTRKATRPDTGDDAGDTIPALVALTERQAVELAKQRERAARAEGEASALRDALAREVARANQADAARQIAEDERDNLATEIIKERERRARVEGELAGGRVVFEQAQGRAERAEAEAEERRAAAAHELVQATVARAAQEAAERARDTARSELGEWMAGGPLARAWRALIYRQGRL